MEKCLKSESSDGLFPALSHYQEAFSHAEDKLLVGRLK